MRGQQASALEHATPEEFWIDRKQCRYTDENGQIQNPSLTDCPQAVSAVKALAIAARQGQKIYTITQKNAAAALPKLSLSRGVAEEIQNAIAAGKEVTVHEKAINAYGFSGFGYIIIDPETGVGGYLIEGKGNGSYLSGLLLGATLAILIITLSLLLIPAAGGALTIATGMLFYSFIAPFLAAIAVFAAIFFSLQSMLVWTQKEKDCFLGGFKFGFSMALTFFGAPLLGFANITGNILSFLGIGFGTANELEWLPDSKGWKQCR